MIKRYYPTQPVLATSMCIFCENELLLVRRNKEPGKGRWTLPGGVVELGERVADALEREMKEELGIRPSIVGFLGLFERIKRDKEGKVVYHYAILNYYGNTRTKNVYPSDEIAEFIWISPERVREFLEEQRLIEAILKASRDIKDHP